MTEAEIQKFDEEIGSLAHRTCFRYAHSENIDFRQYTFSKLTLRQFAEEIKRQTIEEVKATLKWEEEACKSAPAKQEDWAPQRIWLQRNVGGEGCHTWCEDSQDHEEQAEYIRVSVDECKEEGE
jgi:hypothetical protein